MAWPIGFRIISGFQIGLALWCAQSGEAAERKILHGTIPKVTASLPSVGLLPDSMRLNLVISLPLRHQPDLARLLEKMYNPTSPLFHRYLTPLEFSAQFGPAQEDYEALMDYARANHLTITHTHGNRTLLDVNGSVEDIRRVFHVNLRVYQHPTEPRTFFAPDADPSVDTDVPVLAIKGLDDFSRPRSDLKRVPAPTPGTPEPQAGTGANGTFIGKDFRTAYVPGVTLDGTGQSVALVEFDGYFGNDITNYENTPSPALRPVPLTNVLVDDFDGGGSASDAEVPLDIEMLIAMAPGLSQILVYETQPVLQPNADDMLNLIATDDLAAVISCSYIFPTNNPTTDQIFQQYAAQGQSFFNAAGDRGADVPGQTDPVAADPYITIVGGTTLSTGANGVWQSETVWSGTTGGFNSNNAIPWWQQGVNMSLNGGSTSFRNLPDVAMCATNVYVAYGNGKHLAIYGTSCSAPLWAGFAALVNQQASLSGNGPVGFLNPAIYAIGAGPGYATNFHDITTGNNTNAFNPTNYFAVAGYDLCTGWGTPQGSNLINALAPPDTLVMFPIAGFTSTGPADGPFRITAESFVLTNTGTAVLSWSLASDSSWLTVTLAGGSLSPNGSTTVVAALNSAASSLPVGNYAAHLTVTNLSNGLLHHRTFTLQVSDPLAIAPATGLLFVGPPSGPFNAAAETCILTNSSQMAVSWSVVTNPAWLNVSLTGGVLAPFSAVSITCSLNSLATNLASGSYPGGILFSNLTWNTQELRPAVLQVGQFVQNGGFETGDFTGWITSGDASYTSASTSPVAVHSGNYGALLGTDGGPGFLSQTILTVPGNTYALSLWLDSPDGATPNGFAVSWNGNIVATYTNLAALGWTNLRFLLPATQSSTALQFTFRDDASYLGLDDVSVTAGPPVITTISQASGLASGGTPVTIIGSGFQSHATVAFGSVPAASVSFNSPSSLTAVTPASASGLVNVVVANADGQTATLTNGFQFTATSAPVAGNVSLPRCAYCDVKVRIATLLAAASDPNNEALSFVSASSTSTNGASVTVSGNWIFYTAPASTNADAFSYTMADSSGLQTTGWVSVLVAPPSAAQSQNLVATQPVNGGGTLIIFQGIPGRTYTVQYTTNLNSAVWQTLGTGTADATGAFTFTDTPPNGAPTRYYRSAYP